MHSVRFGKEIVITDHASQRMAERGIDQATLLDVIETGEILRLDPVHMFLFKRVLSRHDNLVCAAAVEETGLVIKTVMVNWALREGT